MEASIFNTAYHLKDAAGWISINELYSVVKITEANVLCLKVWQARTNKTIVAIDSFVENFIEKLELKNFSANLEAYEHFFEEVEKKKRIGNYVTIRLKDNVSVELAEHLDELLSNSRQFRFPVGFLTKKERVCDLENLVKNVHSLWMKQEEFISKFKRVTEVECFFGSDTVDANNSQVKEQNQITEEISVDQNGHSEEGKSRLGQEADMKCWYLVKKNGEDVIDSFTCQLLPKKIKQDLLDHIKDIAVEKTIDALVKEIDTKEALKKFIRANLHKSIDLEEVHK